MLVILWEHLRGYSKWVPTEATIESAVKYIDGAYDPSSEHPQKSQPRWKMEDTLVWSDSSGKKYQARFTAHDNSDLFKLGVGAKLIIRCDPAHPARFYSREIHESEVHHFILMTFAVIGVIAVCAGSIALSNLLGCGPL